MTFIHYIQDECPPVTLFIIFRMDAHLWLSFILFSMDAHLWLLFIIFSMDAHLWLLFNIFRMDAHLWLVFITFRMDAHLWLLFTRYIQDGRPPLNFIQNGCPPLTLSHSIQDRVATSDFYSLDSGWVPTSDCYSLDSGCVPTSDIDLSYLGWAAVQTALPVSREGVRWLYHRVGSGGQVNISQNTGIFPLIFGGKCKGKNVPRELDSCFLKPLYVGTLYGVWKDF